MNQITLQTGTTSTDKEIKKFKNVYTKTDQSAKVNLRSRALSNCVLRNNKQVNNKSRNISKTNIINNLNSGSFKNGLFTRQLQKLHIAKWLVRKKQKSVKAKHALGAEVIVSEIIDEKNAFNSTPYHSTITVEDSANKDDNDVIMVSILPGPTFSPKNSTDEGDIKDVFTKSNQINEQSSTILKKEHRTNELSSDFTSCCSSESSDDCIGRNDCSCLFTDTSDTDSLYEDYISSKQDRDYRSSFDNEINELNFAIERIDLNRETSYSLSLLTHVASRVHNEEQDNFGSTMAQQTYECKSDIIKNAYSTSSDEVKNVGTSSPRTKRLFKRRTSSRGKKQNALNYNSDSTDEDDEIYNTVCHNRKLLRTSKAIMAHKNNSNLSSFSQFVQKEPTTENLVSYEHILKQEFPTTLTQDNIWDNQDMEDNEIEMQNVPSPQKIAKENLAVDIKVANSEICHNNNVVLPNHVVDISDSADTDEENHLTYNSTAYDNTIIVNSFSSSESDYSLVERTIENGFALCTANYYHDQRNSINTKYVEYSNTSSESDYTTEESNSENDFSLHNANCHDQQNANTMGWNEEMHRFYYDSWNGDHFVLSNVQRRNN